MAASSLSFGRAPRLRSSGFGSRVVGFPSGLLRGRLLAPVLSYRSLSVAPPRRRLLYPKKQNRRLDINQTAALKALCYALCCLFCHQFTHAQHLPVAYNAIEVNAGGQLVAADLKTVALVGILL